MRNKLSEHSRIAISYSTGSDRDIMADLIELVKPHNFSGEIRYVFFNTGLEYDATLCHIAETERKYGIAIERITSSKTIPSACKEHRILFICKDVSNAMNRLQRHNFNKHTKLKNYRTKSVYVLINYKSIHEQDLECVEQLKELNYNPYIMIYDKENAPPYSKRLARFVNNQGIFRSVDKFEDYILTTKK